MWRRSASKTIAPYYLSDGCLAADHRWNQSKPGWWEKQRKRLTCGSLRALFFAQGAARGAKCSPLEMRERAPLMCNNYKKGVCAVPYKYTQLESRSIRTHISTGRKIISQSKTYTRVLCSVCGARSLWKSSILSCTIVRWIWIQTSRKQSARFPLPLILEPLAK